MALRRTLVVSMLCAVGAWGAEGGDAEFFETRVRPVLAKNCFACHTSAALGGLRADSREGLLKGGKSGAAVAPGNAKGSLLVQAVERTHERLKMPPSGKLTAEEVADLRTWIDKGAVWPEARAAKAPEGKKITPEQRAYWAFQAVKKPSVPNPRDGGWAKTDIDRFLLARMESEGLTPGKAADKRTLLRRVTYDLTGLPPTPEEMAAFLGDNSASAYEKVIDRLLGSPHYGERWGRYWLDLARYSDGQQGAREDTPYANAYRYRDWVVEAFNNDLPYDLFVKAQIAADGLGDKKLLPALGFQALGESDNDRVDVTTRVFLGLTVGCAQCHNHKFDPIPTKDYYSLLGVFRSSKADEYPLAPKEQVEAYKKAKKLSEEKAAELKSYQDKQVAMVVDILSSQTEQYLMAAWRMAVKPGLTAEEAAKADGLDVMTLERWVKYLKPAKREHKFLDEWDGVMKAAGATSEEQARAAAKRLHDAVHDVFAEKKAIEDRNYVKLGGIEGMKDTGKVIATLVDALPIDKYYFWRDMASRPYKVEDLNFAGGVYYYGPKDVDRFFSAYEKRYLATLKAESKALEKAIPEAYPFWHVLSEKDKPANIRVAVRGNPENLGEEAPRRFLEILCKGDCAAFQKGSGRAELAEAIATKENPLTARVMVNRIWKHHFGEGIVRSTSNFGQLGDRPTHPELLDYLASRFVESGWSVKAMHREMLLSAAYQLSSNEEPAANAAKDPDNRFFWRANVRERLDFEALRDSILAAAGTLDGKVGGPAKALKDDNHRRSLYATVSRGNPDRTMALFDFPDANATSEQRIVTVGPMQRLFFMNSPFVQKQAKALAARVCQGDGDDRERIGRAYQILYGRGATAEEAEAGLAFLGGKTERWGQYAQVLLGAAEFGSVE